MCGIAGIVGLDGRRPALDSVRGMCLALVHRGPDEDGFYVGEGATLGMRRLRVIDLATGSQPIGNEDGSVWVVFNGEIYNYRELRRRLEARGHRFRTAGDTEAIVHLYEDEGAACVSSLRGMFAFALWDARRRKLMLARDRLGIKPLYYVVQDGQLAFASELKAILQLPEVERRLNWRAVGHLLTFLTTPPLDSVVEGVRKLAPGHVLTASPEEGIRLARYWEPTFAPDYGLAEHEIVARLREQLAEAVRLHLASDVPLGVFLSGGLDSSTVVATMARLGAGPIRTFTVGFKDADFSEVAQARQVARAFGTDHRELVLDPDALPLLEQISYHLDEPFGDSSAIPTFMVSRLAADHVTVVLSGDGGDEVFGGYQKYVVEGRERVVRLLPPFLRRGLRALARQLPPGTRGRNLLRHLTWPGAERYLDACTLFGRDERRALLRHEVLERMAGYDPWTEPLELLARSHGHWLSSLQYLDFNGYLPLDILAKVDRMSMAHSLETRVPLLDHVLVEFAATIPPELKLRHGSTKHILKRAMRGILPDAIIDRPKQGFAIPLGRWFRGRLGDHARDLLLSEPSRTRGLFDPRALEGVLRDVGSREDLGLELWTLISLELWCRNFLDGPVRLAPAAPAWNVTGERRAS